MRARLVGALAAAIVIGVVPVAKAEPGAPTPYPGGTWSPPAPRYTSQVTETNRSIRMSDGTVLEVDISWPVDASGNRPMSAPVVLNQDPYTGGVTSLLPSTSTAPGPNTFVQHGYIWVHLHQRGTGGPGPNGSGGGGDLSFGPRLGLDGVETAYWAADPANVEGSDGNVGMVGCSALGGVQLATLAALGAVQRVDGPVHVPGRTADDEPTTVGRVSERPIPIKAAIPECFAASLFREQFTDNGIATTQFAGLAVAPVAAAPIFGFGTSDVGSQFMPTMWAADYMTGGEFGFDRDFWRGRDYLRRADDIGRTGVPVLMWVGNRESGFSAAQPLYAALQNVVAGRPHTAPMAPGQKTDPRYQVIVPDLGHGGGIDKGIELEWFETWVRGVNTGLRKATGAMRLAEISATPTNQWIAPRAYPIASPAEYRAVYLDATSLADQASGSPASDQLVWTPGLGAQLAYTTAPLATDRTLAGPQAAQIWVRSTTTNAQLYLELQQVAPDGTATEITHGSILASRRKLDPERTWLAANGAPMRPWLALDADRFITPNVPVKLDVPLLPRTWRIPAGHRLRLVIAANPGSRCVPSNPFGAPIAYGCVLNAPMAQSLAGGVFQVLRGGTQASMLNLALLDPASPRLHPVGSAPTPTSGGVAQPQDW